MPSLTRAGEPVRVVSGYRLAESWLLTTDDGHRVLVRDGGVVVEVDGSGARARSEMWEAR